MTGCCLIFTLKKKKKTIQSKLVLTATSLHFYWKRLFSGWKSCKRNAASSAVKGIMCAGGGVNIKTENEVCSAMRPSARMALFGMVWLLRVRSEMKRCAKCKRDNHQQDPSTSTFFTIDAPLAPTTPSTTTAQDLAPTTYCEVHGYNVPKEGIYFLCRPFQARFLFQMYAQTEV